jgi:hypothetical protein
LFTAAPDDVIVSLAVKQTANLNTNSTLRAIV